MRRAVAALGALLLAAAATAGSGANFTSSSASTANVIRAGIVSVANGSAGQAVLTVTGLAPGHSQSGSVTLTNSGDLAANWTLKATGLVDSPASPALSARLDLVVQDGSKTVWSGKFGALSSVALGTWAAGEKHTLTFTVSMPDNGTSGSDDAYQNARCTLDFAWTATGVTSTTTTATTTTATTTTATTATTTTATTTTATKTDTTATKADTATATDTATTTTPKS